MSDEIYHPTPRVLSDVPLGTSFPSGTTDFPTRARDDLDPGSPPLEYADGRITWDGHPSREDRDRARLAAAFDLHRRRTDQSPDLVATRALRQATVAIDSAEEARRCGAITAERRDSIVAHEQGQARRARAQGGSEQLAAAAGLCVEDHRHDEGCSSWMVGGGP